MTHPIYTAITFAPVQGFIEKSRQLRDLYGASLILSHLSKKIVDAVNQLPNCEVISPGLPNLEKGMPNRILIKGELSQDKVQRLLLDEWQKILQVCRSWIDDPENGKLRELDYSWDKEWRNWGHYAWEVFWGQGSGKTEDEGIILAMEDLETRKLSRAWKAINWIGESSSLTGADGIAFPGLGAETRNPKHLNYSCEKKEIEQFYQRLAEVTEEVDKSDNTTEESTESEDESEDEQIEGKFIDPNEKLSIPELVKRLVTRDDIANTIGMEKLDRGFKEIQRKPTNNRRGQWTGWFMGDGDKVGDKLKEIARQRGEQGIKDFSYEMRNWGKNFYNNFYKETRLGRVIYAGGDDFLGVIYSRNPRKPVKPLAAFEWLMTLRSKWRENKQECNQVNLSVGFVWVAGSVPQRDVLQHCREAEKLAKSRGRNRVTIRVVFNSGQYVQWTCPWDYLHILKKYSDRNGESNWSHVYGDLAQLDARHAFEFKPSAIDYKFAIEFFDLYFPGEGEYLESHIDHLVGEYDDQYDRAVATTNWIRNLIYIGWHLCSNPLNT